MHSDCENRRLRTIKSCHQSPDYAGNDDPDSKQPKDDAETRRCREATIKEDNGEFGRDESYNVEYLRRSDRLDIGSEKWRI